MPGGHGDIAKAALLSEEEREKSVVISDPSRPDNPMIYVSEEFETQTGYPPGEVLGRPLPPGTRNRPCGRAGNPGRTGGTD